MSHRQKLEDGDVRLGKAMDEPPQSKEKREGNALSCSQAGAATLEIPPPAPMIHRAPMKAKHSFQSAIRLSSAKISLTIEIFGECVDKGTNDNEQCS